MLHVTKIAAGAPASQKAYAKHIFEPTLPADQAALAAYYLRDKAITMGLAEGMQSIPCVRTDLPSVAADAIGLAAGTVITEEEMGAILSGRRGDGKDIKRTQKKAKRWKAKAADEQDRHDIAAFDFCFSAPKSFSVAWAFAESDAERASLMQAEQAALREALLHMEAEIGQARKGDSGSKGYEKAHMTWIRVDHYTARPTAKIKRRDPITGKLATELYTIRPDQPGDCQIHHHIIVPNVLVTDKGRITSIHQGLFFNRKKEFGAFYQAALAKHLRKLGVKVELDQRTNMAKLPCIPESVCDEFSKRTADAKLYAKEEAARRGLDWEAMSDDAKVDFLKGGSKASRKWKVDDLANIESWNEQAEAIGFRHDTAITEAPQDAPDDRIEKAAAVARGLLAERLKTQSVVTRPELRLEATRGLIAAGFNEAADIKRVTDHMARAGVLQDGQKTHLLWVEMPDGQYKITTGLHKEQEDEVIALAKTATADTSHALTMDEIEAAIAETGIEFKGDHGKAQRAAVDALGMTGLLSVLIGIAGAGKTHSFKPLVHAWRQRGYEVWGTALAKRTSTDLRDAGIEKNNTRALSPFLKGIADGRYKLNEKSVVVLDEISQVGTRQLLELLHFQKQFGFQIVAAGDELQCQAVEAGAVIDLLRRALGDEAIPEILSTIRQKTKRERDIANLFREGKPEAAGKAIDMKREDGTAELVDGGYEDAVDRIAELAVEHGATVSAPTNKDAMEIGRAIRKKRGIAGGYQIKAANGRGDDYDMELAPGDKVRLFGDTWARFETNNSSIGSNGSILEVVSATDEGLAMKTKEGKIGFVAWDKMKEGDRVKLAYGDCMTVDLSQGITSNNHIMAFPAGTDSVDGFKAYVASSRHRYGCWLVTSKGFEMASLNEQRPKGIPDPITDRDLWANVARNLSRQTVKENATSILSQVAETDIGISKAFQAAARRTGPTAAKRKYAFANLARAIRAGAARVRALTPGPGLHA